MIKNQVMAKEKEKVVNVAPEGMKCYQKEGGGSFRFQNRIIKPGQKFWINPDSIPASFLGSFKEVAADYKAIVVSTNVSVSFNRGVENKNAAEKFELVPATDEKGKVITKGTDSLYNVIDETGKPMNDKPLREGKAKELLAALNV